MSGLGHYNFKKITDLFQEISRAHEQIMSYGIGDAKQLMYYITERLKQDNQTGGENLAPYYPLMYVIPQGMTNDGRKSIFEFNILVMDILNTKNFDNEVDVWSDCLDILKDIVAKLKYSTGQECFCNWDVETPTTFLPFSEQYDDYVSGWNAVIKLTIPDALDLCSAPFATFKPCSNNDPC